VCGCELAGSVAGKTAAWLFRSVASAFLAAEHSFRRIQGYRDLCMLKARLAGDITLEAKEMSPEVEVGWTVTHFQLILGLAY